ncbi:MAG TPA: secretin N-terminal domain-containing protein [Thermoguttaceae bacterium]|nr:secretin N-terminal domain-containing protein [Thermoguttaceae bacterium]
MESRRAYFALGFIRDAVPEATLTLNSDSSQLIAWARPKDHERIAELIEQVLHEPPELARKAIVYTLKWITAEKATQFLEDVARGADFATGEDPQQLIAFARPAEHEVIASALEQIDVEPSPETTTRAVVYALKSISPDSAIETLEEAVPSASFTSAEGSQKLTALARPADHVMIERILKEIDVEEPADAASNAVVYTLESVKASTAIQILQQAVPDASFNEGSEANQLIAWARPKDHEIIERALKQIDVEGPADKVARPVVYALEDMTTQRAYYALTFLRQAVPDAELTLSSDGSRLIAFATPKDHELLGQLIRQLNEEPPELARQAVVYDLQVITATEAMTLLRQAVPMADLSAGAEPSQLVAWARQSDQEKIVRILEKIDREGPAETAATVRIYSLEGLDSRSAIYANLFLRQTVPDARFSPGAEPTQIVAWARPKDHELIAELVQQLIEEPPALARKAVVYHLEEITATEAMTLMRQAVPGATISAGADASQLVVWARQSDQEKVQRILEQVDQAGPEGTAAAVIYSLEGLSSRSAIYANRFLQQTVPDARFSPGAEPTQIVAWARPKDHELIAELVKQLVEEPPELARKAVAYDLKHATATSAIQALSSAVPDASLSPGADENQVVAWARADEHEKIQEILKELDREPSPETEPKAMVYSLEAADAAEAMRVLRTAVPQARLSIGAEPHQLIAWARPADHEIIQEIVDKMVEKGPDELARKVVVYTLETTDAQDAIRFLSSAVPDAEFSIGTDPRRLIAWARPRDHEIISRAVEAMSKEEPPETAPRVVVYTLKTVDATRALELLREAVPDAQLTVGTDARQLIAWARPADHEIIADAVEKMSQEEPAETRPRVVLYDVEATGAANAMDLLQAAVPEAKLGVGDDPGKLIAWARPEDHEVIQAAVEQFEADSWLEGKRIISVYPIKAGDAESLVQVLQPKLKDYAQFVVDSERNSLVVWADAKHHEAINKTIEEFIEGLEGTQEMTSQVYRFQLADPAVALSVLQTLVPSARLALDENTQSIVASALPEDHDKIRATIQEMEREDVEGQRPVLRIHRVETGDVGNIYSALYALFRQDPTVQLNVDRANDAIIAIASPLKHDKIDQLIEEVAKGVLLDAANVLELYSMKNVDTDSAMEILETLLEKRGATADLSLDSRSNQLVAIARPDHHALIRETLEQLRREEPGLEIYDLEYVDPVSAEMAIGSEFDDEGYLSAPQVDIDPITQQLFVRANPEQHQRIRQLLIKMGETKLQLLGDRSTRSMRVIPFRGDLEGAIAEIQRIWPKLRENEIRVVTPSVALPPPAEPQPKPEAPKAAPAEPKPEPAAKPAEAMPAEAKPEPKAPKQAPAEPKPEPAAKPEEAKPAEAKPAEPAPKEAPPAEAKPKPEAPKEAPAEPKPEPAAKPAEAMPAEAMPAEPAPKETPPAEPKPEPTAKPAEAKPAEPAPKEAPPAEAKPKPEAPKEAPAEPAPTEATYTLSLGTASEAIEALKAKFPDAKLSAGDQPNQLVVVAKPADHEAVKKALEEMSKGQPAEKPQEPAPKETPPAEKPAEPAPKEAPPAEKPAESSSGESAFLDPWRIFAQFELGSPTPADQSGQPPKESPQEQPQAKAADQTGSTNPSKYTQSEKPVSGREDAAEKPAESPPPLYIVLGEGSVTLVSDDPEALDQFEQLLRTLLPSTNTIGRNISVFELKHSSAAAVAEKLEDLFRSSPFGFRRGAGSVVIVPDERMNSILVQGSRIDRETVEGLLTVLDSDEVPDALAGQKPQLIPIKNVDAAQIAEVIQSVFKSQLSPPTSRSRNGRTTTSVLPSPQVAVDEGTNSLVVMATSPLLDEIIDLAEKLDEEAGKNPSRRVKIIPLEKTNASRVQRALEQILNKPSSSRRSR